MTLSFPSDPINGAVSGEYTYDATKGAWRKNAAYPTSVTHSDVAPSNPREGDQWWKSNEGTLFTYYNDGTSSQWVESTNVVASSDPNPIPAGAMMAWASDVIPANWLLCDGSAISRSTYASLFAAVGTQYGTGDGTTTFNLPNLKGRTIVGKDSAQTEFDTLGETGGAKTHTLTASEVPSHTHTFSGTSSTDGAHVHTFGANQNGVLTHATGGGGYSAGFTNQGAGEMLFYRSMDAGAGSHSHTYSGTTSSAGSGSAHNNLQPYIVLNYIIKFSAGETPGDSQLAVRVGALETTTVRSVALGGTGASTLTSGAYLKGAGTSAVTTQVGIPKSDLPAGTILQVATWRETSPFTSTATSFTSLLSVSITPRSTSSTMYIVCTLNGAFTGADAARRNLLSLFRDSTNISNPNAAGSRSPSVGGFFTQTAANGSAYQTVTVSALDSPSTTSSVAYSIRTRMEGGDTLYINRNVGDSDSALYPRGVSTITVFEVQG